MKIETKFNFGDKVYPLVQDHGCECEGECTEEHEGGAWGVAFMGEEDSDAKEPFTIEALYVAPGEDNVTPTAFYVLEEPDEEFYFTEDELYLTFEEAEAEAERRNAAADK